MANGRPCCICTYLYLMLVNWVTDFLSIQILLCFAPALAGRCHFSQGWLAEDCKILYNIFILFCFGLQLCNIFNCKQNTLQHLWSYKRRWILIHDVQDQRTILLQKKNWRNKIKWNYFLFFGESKNFAYDLGLWLSFQNPLEMILYLRSNKIVTGKCQKAFWKPVYQILPLIVFG